MSPFPHSSTKYKTSGNFKNVLTWKNEMQFGSVGKFQFLECSLVGATVGTSWMMCQQLSSWLGGHIPVSQVLTHGRHGWVVCMPAQLFVFLRLFLCICLNEWRSPDATGVWHLVSEPLLWDKFCRWSFLVGLSSRCVGIHRLCISYNCNCIPIKIGCGFG